MKRFYLLGIAALVIVSTIGFYLFKSSKLSNSELEIASSLSLNNLPPLPDDPSNAVADNPLAVAFGEALFNDIELSANGQVSCASCHLADREFQDDLPVGHGIGFTDRRTMPLRGAGYSPWLFWDGRKDSLWSQAIGPLESAVEHGLTRSEVAIHVTLKYSEQYTALFGPSPDISDIPAASPLGNETQQVAWQKLPEETKYSINQIFANTGKSIAAFERTLNPVENRLDRYVSVILANETLTEDVALTPQEIEGFRVFVGKGNCTNCHNGPRLTDEFFHNTGVASSVSPPTDQGRADAIAQVDSDPFNCLGRYSDANPNECGELRFMSRDTHLYERAFKSPSLRGVAGRPPYMHAGQLTSLTDVIEHYDTAPSSPSGHSELEPLGLSESEKHALEAFLNTL